MSAKKKVLFVSQTITPGYVDLLRSAMGDRAEMDIITGSAGITGNVISSPAYESDSVKSRFSTWDKHFRFMQNWMRRNRKQHYDLIFAVSNPPINSYIGLQLKRRFHAPFLYMNWDLYPQVVRATIRNPVAKVVCKGWSIWNGWNYKKIDGLLTIGNEMASSVNADIKKPVDVQVIPIGVDTEQLKPIEKKDNPFCAENGLTDKFVVLYSGKMGLGHNIEMILEASEKLADQKDILFVFIGSGPKYQDVEAYIGKYNPENVRLFPLQSEEMFPFSMACGDVGVVSQEASMAQLFMPSKTYSMMACGEAVVGIGTERDDLSRLIREEEIGIVVTDGTADSLANAVLELYKDRDRLDRCKKNARASAMKRFDVSVIKAQYEALFERYLGDEAKETNGETK